MAALSALYSSLRLSAGHSYLCFWFYFQDMAALSALRFLTFVGRTFVPLPHGSTVTMDMSALSALQLATFVGRDIRTFASGLQMDVSALSALQLAMLVGRSCRLVSWPLVSI